MKIKNKQQIFDKIVEAYTDLFGDKLHSIYVYGSAITDDFDPKTSDINIAMILDNLKLQTLVSTRRLIKNFKKKGVSAPLFLSNDYIKTSLDTYPIEFLDIKSNHKTLYGDDLFSQIDLSPKFLRLQAERELKGRLLLLRLSFLENIQKKKYILPVIKKSIKSIIPILKAILLFTENKIPDTALDIINFTSEKLDMELVALIQAWDYTRKKKIKSSTEDVVNFFQEYVKEVDKLSHFVDQFKID
ncbi:MAG: hypothetical protein KGY75_01420 [Candidatus Cloacimonetes bacterium]|nr:hypothetical protein [Candidatus Cloacimonadota bacterium]MBS3766771.1 hypothetical protein [Candidatus Cloacimonadota bacterium]